MTRSSLWDGRFFYVLEVMKMKETIQKYENEAVQLAKYLYANPEICNEEYLASKRISELLEKHGFTIEKDIAGHPTGFIADYRKGRGPSFAVLLEYDALPDLGHACGHHLFAAISYLTALAGQSLVDRYGGHLRVYGTPGEEGGDNGSAKASYVDAGLFDDMDAAFCLHPAYEHGLTVATIANAPVEVVFKGAASHAASAPEKGRNALDAMVFLFNGVNAYREHAPKDALIHGVILEGGSAPNIVPDYTRARFFIRADEYQTVEEILKRFEMIVEGAAQMADCDYEYGLYQNPVKETWPCPSFDAIYYEELLKRGHDVVEKDGSSFGSSDVGNVSQVIPTIQPSLNIANEEVIPHTHAFREACNKQMAYDQIAFGAELLAASMERLFKEPEMLEKISKEHSKIREEKLQNV